MNKQIKFKKGKYVTKFNFNNIDYIILQRYFPKVDDRCKICIFNSSEISSEKKLIELKNPEKNKPLGIVWICLEAYKNDSGLFDRVYVSWIDIAFELESLVYLGLIQLGKAHHGDKVKIQLNSGGSKHPLLRKTVDEKFNLIIDSNVADNPFFNSLVLSNY